MEIAVIGVGMWGKNYLRTLKGLGVRVKWICASTDSGLEEAATMVEGVKVTTDYKDILLDEDVDAVMVVTGGSTHYRLARDALEAGKHVLVEKPMALNVRDAEELVKLAEEKSLVLMVGHVHLYNSAVRKLKEDIGAGLFGEIKFMHSIGTGGPIRKDMSALWDYGPHDISIASYLLGEYPSSVDASATSYLRAGFEDVVSMVLNFSKNVRVWTFGSWLYPVKQRVVVVVGSKLSAVFDDHADVKLRYYDGKAGRGVVVNDDKPLTRELNHFLECIKGNKRPEIDGVEGLEVVKVLEAAQKSIKVGKIVDVYSLSTNI